MLRLRRRTSYPISTGRIEASPVGHHGGAVRVPWEDSAAGAVCARVHREAECAPVGRVPRGASPSALGRGSSRP